MKDFVEFRTMVTPGLLQFLWVAGSLLVVLSGLAFASAGETASDVWTGLGLAVFGPLVLRIYAEVSIILFKLHERMGDILNAVEDLVDQGAEPGPLE